MSLPEPHSYGQGTSGDDFMRPFYWAEEVEDISAELAALKERTCNECEHFTYTCHRWRKEDPDFACNRYAAREETS